MARRDNLPAGLLDDVKNHLGITWTDDATDTRIAGLVIDSKYGGDADYVEDGFPRTLLMEYVRYARDAALDIFENNYAALILAMQHERQVERLEELQIPEP